jgi:hypothetical protein
MFQRPISSDDSRARHRADLLACLADSCTRPRYAYMLLSLLADIARPDGSAGPLVSGQGGLVPLRDWLGEALGPLADRDGRRRGVAERAARDLAAKGALPQDPARASALLAEEVRARVLASGKANVSRTVSELVRAGLLKRHYQGYRVDHHNRGAQRQSVYILSGQARLLLRGAPARAQAAAPVQLGLF